MPANKFIFKSPGVQVAEIDRSGIPSPAPAIGPAVIGRAVHGPAMMPVRLESTADLYRIFGPPSPGGKGGDVWRDGNFAAPTYGVYAAEAYLRNNGPVTFVRLAGEQHPEFTAASGEAGWTAMTASGLFVANALSQSAGGLKQVTASLGAVFYLTDAAASVQLMSTTHGQTTPVTTAGTLVQNESSVKQDLVFTAVISGAIGAGDAKTHLTATFDFDPNSEKYIRKVFNTNPHYTNHSLYGSGSALNYWLGETYESSLQEIVCAGNVEDGAPAALPSSSMYAFSFLGALSGTTGGGADLAQRDDPAAAAKSGFVFSQDLTQEVAAYQPQDQQKLFRFVAVNARGEWDNRRLKISIVNVKAAVNPTVNPYGTFDVFIRNTNDTDNSLNLLESFTSLNLNPASPNYIARRIGDRYLNWDTTEKYYEEYGTYNNVSKYIRMEMNDEVDNATANSSVLPFGYFGPIRTATQTATAALGIADIGDGSMFTGPNVTTASSEAYGEDIIAGFEARVEFPRLSLRESGTYGVSAPRKAFYGMRSQGTFARRDNGYSDYTGRLSSDIADPYGDGSASPGTGLEYSFIFTLDDVSGSAAAPVYLSGSRADTTSFRGEGTVNTLLDAGINSFTMPLVAGTDGLDITEPEPFANRLISGLTEKTSYEMYSVRKAIDMLGDPDVIEHNVVAVPGISDPLITDYLVDMAGERKDTLAIIDIERDYKPRFELLSTEIGTNRTALPVVSSAVSDMVARGFNSSYGAAYYPAVQIRDRGSNTVLYVPATVAAMAAFGYTERVAEPWFAPAGFSRGGLSDGSTGIVATGVSRRLTSKERDDLYGVNVNPIAQFPQEGVVIFGQKTLLAEASALDRVNVRRLLIFVKKEISRIANTTLFQPNNSTTWAQFLRRARPFMNDVKAKFGLEDYRLILDETTTTDDLKDQNIMYAKVLLKPTRAVEFIAIDFEIFRSGASFDI
jgi:hypothetical protein